jgi:activator of HSP90 ATPase
MILGRNVECAPNERLVQAWRVKTWDPGVYSIVRFELRPEGKSTRLLLDHTGFPTGQGEHLAQGWHANYWEPLRKALT